MSRFSKRRQPQSLLSTQKELQLAVLTAPGNHSESGGLLRTDLELVRSSILYADKIELYSIGATLMRSAEEVRKGGYSATFEVMMALSPALQSQYGLDSWPQGWQQMLSAIPHLDTIKDLLGPSLPPELRRKLDDATASIPNLNSVMDDLQKVVETIINQSGMEELWPAIRRRGGRDGILKLGYVGPDDGGNFGPADLAHALDPGPWLGNTLANWLVLTNDILLRDDTTILLDEVVGSVLSELLKAGMSGGPRLKAGAAGVGTGMLARLPAFPGSKVDELLDVRDEVGSSLQRYRTASAALASKNLTSDAFTQDWHEEIEAIWLETVQPSIIEIEDELTDSSFVKELAKSFSTDARFLVTGGSALLGYFAPVTTIQSAAGVVAGVIGGVAAPVAGAVAGAAGRSRQAARKVHRDGLSYLVAVNRRLTTLE